MAAIASGPTSLVVVSQGPFRLGIRLSPITIHQLVADHLIVQTVLVTGANGFVGVPVCQALARVGWRVLGGVRRADAVGLVPPEAIGVLTPDASKSKEWRPLLRGVDALVHLVARTHVLRDSSHDPVAEYRRTNVDGLRRLATECVRCRVRRLVFMSSIKAVGEGAATAYTEESPLRPEDAYGISKMEAEQTLFEIADQTDTEAVVLRPPLVYGPRVAGNVLRLLHWTRRGLPLPLAAVNNRRSMVHVGNLADATAVAVEHPRAAREVFHVADDQILSTSELLTQLSALRNRPRRLFRCPLAILRAAGWLLGRQDDIRRLTGSLIVSNRKLRNQLGWQPQYTTEEGLRDMLTWFVQHQIREDAAQSLRKKPQARRAA